MRLVLEDDGKGQQCLQQYSSFGISRIFRVFQDRNNSEDLDRGMRPSRVFKSQHFLVIKIFPWRLKKILATFFYNKFYRWLTVAPLGDGAFLKESRTSDLHSLGGWPVPHPLCSLGGWPVPHPLGCPSFAGMIFSENILAVMKTMDLHQYKLSTYPILLI